MRIQSPLEVSCKTNFRFEIPDFSESVDPKFYKFYRSKWQVFMKEIKDRVKDKRDYDLLPEFRTVIAQRKQYGNKIDTKEIASKLSTLEHPEKDLMRSVVDVSPILDRAYGEQLAYVLVGLGFNPKDFAQ